MKKERLCCEKARSICIVKSLAKLGHFPSRTTEKEAWFLSPLRSETQASFKVSKMLNRWYDFGIGKGGNVVDLVCLIKNCSVKEALCFLADDLTIPLSEKSRQPNKKNRIAKNEVIGTTEISNFSLLNYLQSRRIPLSIAQTYCKEVWYTCNGKTFFALGLHNNSGGWELRNEYSKTSTAPKTYSHIKNAHSKLLIVEGMFDLLSLPVLLPEAVEKADLLILNSLSFIEEIQSVVQSYTAVDVFLDNDAAGKQATHFLLSEFPNYTDRSSLYKGYKDPNEKLIRNALNHLFG